MKSRVTGIVLAVALFAAVAVAKKYPITAASNVPAARGEANVGQDKNGNTKVKIEVEHLAAPENLTPPKSAYIVWFQERGGPPVNQGQLKVDKKLKATFQTVTPVRSFDLFVTAESDPSIKSPEGAEVLRSSIQPQ